MSNDNDRVLIEETNMPPATDVLNEIGEKFNNAMFLLQTNITARQSSNKALKNRYFLDKSYFDRAALWYGEKAWWKKLLIGSAVVALSALIGAIFDLAALLTVISIGILAAVSCALQNHNDILTSRSERFSEDITKLEAANKAEYEQLSQIEVTMKNVLGQLQQTLVRMNDEITAFRITIVTLHTQIDTLQTNIHELNTAKDQLAASNKDYLMQTEQLNNALLAAQTDLGQKVLEINALTSQLNKAQSKVSASAINMEKCAEDYQNRLRQLAELENTVHEQLKSSKENNLMESKQISAASEALIAKLQNQQTALSLLLNSDNSNTRAGTFFAQPANQRLTEQTISQSTNKESLSR